MGSIMWVVSALLLVAAVHAELDEPELYVADYYPQADHYRYRYHYQLPQPQFDHNDYLRLGESGYFVDYPPTNALYNSQNKHESNSAFNKRILSSFRERMEREKSKQQHEKLADIFLQKLQEEVENKEMEKEYDDNRDYIEMIEELWEKYKNSYDKDAPIFVGEMNKRQQVQIPVDYSTLGWSGVGYKKRSLDDLEMNYYKQDPDYLYAKRKRFPVAKRSSNFYNTHHKRGVSNNDNNKQILLSASGTDPKILQDLNHIFGNKENATESSSTSTVTIKPNKPINENKNSGNKKVTPSVTAAPIVVTKYPDTKHLDEPLNIKKKSIDWSNYFGIDRRKKKSFVNDNEIDNEWLVKRYNSVVTKAVKRNSEYPLNIFRNHNTKPENEMIEFNEKFAKKQKSDESKLRDMDDKLKNIEDIIIDEALKYTGSHDGETDPAEIQEIKDKVISRLATAYSLEKMRRALSEFKSSLAAQKNDYKNVERTTPTEPEPNAQVPMQAEQKKNSNVARKCTSKTDLGCDDTDIEASNEIQLLGTSNVGRCNVIENRCHRLMSGEFNDLFYTLCKWHQLCYICQEDIDMNSCDIMFVERAEAACRSDVACEWAARPALAALRQLPLLDPHCDRAQICARAR